jgi:leucyl-tRNA synthetase
MFMGNFLEGGDFRDSGMDATKRFLNRVWDTANMPEGESSIDLKIKMAETVDKVSYSIENIKYNTAVAAIMEFINEATKEAYIEKKIILDLAKLLSPFAPFISEEINEMKGGKGTILDSGFPERYEKYKEIATIEVPVQINGKMRGKVEVNKDAGQEKILEKAQEDKKLARYIEGRNIKKVIYIKDKIMNIIVK